MSLAEEYKRQFQWRDWSKVLDLCPTVPGQRVLDLGCGPGDLSAQFVARGCIVTGVDGNQELLNAARQNCPTKAIFIHSDLAALNLQHGQFDGLWCSFTAAYFTDFAKVLESWLPLLKPDAWVCITDIDDLFGHTPIQERFRLKLDEFYAQAFKGGRYDFRVGGKIQGVLEEKGFVASSVNLKDTELSFDGKASADVIKAWDDRLNRMGGFKSFMGYDYQEFKHEFLACLQREDHLSQCKVVCSYGRRSSV